jgi:hypothetical protein
MAITKAVSANPVRGYYVTTIYNGRRVLKSGTGTGFGAPRLGGLINARVDGLAGGGTAGNRLQTPMAGAGAEAAIAAIQASKKVEAAKQHDAKVEPQAEVAKPVVAETVKSDVSKATPEHLEAKKEDIKKPDSVK